MTTNKKFSTVQLGTSASAAYTAPANTSTVLKKVTITNTTPSAVTLSLYLVPSAATAGAANMITSAKSLGPNQTYEAYEAENHVLNAGDSLQGLASAATSLTLQVSGIEIV